MATELVKYPRTPHLPWSEGAAEDDIVSSDADMFTGMEVVVTEKLDGENTTMTSEKVHARSLDSRDHPSRHYRFEREDPAPSGVGASRSNL